MDSSVFRSSQGLFLFCVSSSCVLQVPSAAVGSVFDNKVALRRGRVQAGQGAGHGGR